MTIAATLTSLALILGLYATAVSTMVALVTLYGEVFARVEVIGLEAYLVPIAGGNQQLVVIGDDALKAIGATDAARRPIVTVAIRNKGRRPVQIKLVSKAGGKRGFYVLDELLSSLPLVVEPGHTRELTIGAPPTNAYTPGELGPMKRFFVVDGAGGIHPLHERWRQAPGRFWRRLKR